jgi:TPR repeat protein
MGLFKFLFGNRVTSENLSELVLKAQSGNAQAQYKVGMTYYFGESIPQNYAEAVKWLRLAAEQNVVSAQRLLGFCYSEGHGVEKNEVLAFVWWAIAGAQGDGDALNLAEMSGKLMSPEQRDEGTRLAHEYAVKYVKPRIGP